MTAARLPVVHECAVAPAARGRGAIALGLALRLAGGLAWLMAGVTLGALGALGPGSHPGGRGADGGDPDARDAALRPAEISIQPVVGDDMSPSVATVIAPAIDLPVRDAGPSAGDRR